MKASIVVRSLSSFPLPSTDFPTCSRNQLSFSPRIFICRAKYDDGSFSLRVVPPNRLAVEKKEPQAVLNLFLKKQGLADLVNFPSPPGKERTEEIQQKTPVIEQSAAPISPPSIVLDTKQQNALAPVSDIVSAGKFPPDILYLMDLGMDIELIMKIIKKFPAFAYGTLEEKIMPVVEFFLDLGVPKSDIPIILGKRPHLCGISLTENLIPTMSFLEDLSVDKKQWAKVIFRFPALLSCSRQKMKATVDFLYEMGLSSENVGKVLTRYPQIITHSVKYKLRPTAEYFFSLGVDVAIVLYRCPQTFCQSIENKLKPVTEFFLERRFSIGDIATMVRKYPNLYTFSLSKNMVQKWEFFLSMEYSRSELIKFPQYFSYSLEKRIKPRYEIVKEIGVRLGLSQLLSRSDEKLDKLVKKKFAAEMYTSHGFL